MESIRRCWRTYMAFWEALFTVPDIQHDMAHRTAKTNKEIEDARASIHKNQYMLHMALAEQEAMNEWLQGRIRK